MSNRVKEAYEALIEQMEEPPTWAQVSRHVGRPRAYGRRRPPAWATAVGVAVVVLISVVAVLLATSQTATAEELDTTIPSAINALLASPGVEGVQRAHIDEYHASSVWFDFRPDTGDAVVVQQVDLDVTQTAWWLVEGGKPPATGDNISTTAWIEVDDTLFLATSFDTQQSRPWTAADTPPGPLAFGLFILTEEGYGLDVNAADGEVTRREMAEGGEVWTLAAPYQDGTAIQTWRINDAGQLANWSVELVDITAPIDGGTGPFTSGEIEFTSVSDPDPISSPDPGATLDLTGFNVPEGFSLSD